MPMAAANFDTRGDTVVGNPFEAEDSAYLVLVNDEGQYSLWPAWANVPSGWNKKFGPQARDECMSLIERHWSDMRPLSLVHAMGE